MNALFLFSVAKLSIDRPIEGMSARQPSKGLKPSAPEVAPGIHRFEKGELELAPGIYRFAAGAQVSMVPSGAGDALISPVPADKTHWPDPPLVAKVVSVLHIPEADVRTFFAGQSFATELT